MMKQNNKVFAKRSGVLTAGTLSVLLALGGCGGGGGGGGSAVSRTTVFPTLEDAGSGDVDGFVAPYALNPLNLELQSVPITVLGAGAVNGDLTITVDPIDLPDGKQEPGFVVTFDLANDGSILTVSPLDGLCTDCLREVSVGVSGSNVTIIYLDPNSENFDLNFSTLGMWSKPTTVDDTPWDEVGGPFSAGVTADGALLPATGEASYDGFFIGRFATASDPEGLEDGTYLVGADAQAGVNFGAGGSGQVTFSTSGTNISKEGTGGVLGNPVSESRLDITTSALPINRNNASFTGNANTNGFDMSGNIAGGFYGPGNSSTAPPELGGAVAVGNGDRSMVGSFGLKKTGQAIP